MNRQSIRPSLAPGRVSHAHALANSPALVHRLQELKLEYEAVTALERASALFAKRIEGLAEDCQVMADAGQIHGQVLEQWPSMFHILSLFLANRQQYAESEGIEASSATAPGERLVRIPLDEVQVANANTS